MPSPRSFALTGLILVLLAACAKIIASPQDQALRFVSFCLAGQAKEAYALIGESDKAHQPLADFRSVVENASFGAALAGKTRVLAVDSRIDGDRAQVTLEISAELPSFEAIERGVAAELAGGAAGKPQALLRVEADGKGKIVTRSMILWLKREGGQWRVWPDYEGQRRAAPLVARARAEAAKGRIAAARAALEKALAECPQSEAARDALAGLVNRKTEK